MLRVLVASLIAIVALAACGSNDDGSSDEETVTPTSSPNGGEALPPDGAGIQTHVVGGASMQPTFENGTLLEVHAYVDDLPQRGDIIVFNSPTATHREFLKRVIGLPGDVISIDEEANTVSISGEVLAEPYIQGVTNCGVSCEVTVPPSDAGALPSLSPLAVDPQGNFAGVCETACYFVMGDNRQNSSDSRQGWLVPAENIVGWVQEP